VSPAATDRLTCADSILAILPAGVDLLSEDGLQKVKEREGAIDEWLRNWEPVCGKLALADCN
jgi:hypothetical protein